MIVQIKSELLVRLLPFVDPGIIYNNINSIRFEAGYAVASNGHYMVFHEAPLSEPTEVFNFCVPKATRPALTTALKKAAKKSLDVVYDTETRELRTIDAQTFTLEKTDGHYPDWRQQAGWIKNLDPTDHFLDAKYLGLFSNLTKGGISIYGAPDSDVCVIIPNAKNLEWFAICMCVKPYKTPEERKTMLLEAIEKAGHSGGPENEK